MAFRDPIAYLMIKIRIKSKLPKIALQQKIRLVKIENPKGLIAKIKIEPKKRPKLQPKQPKGIGPLCNLVTTCLFRNHASIGHISLVSTLNFNIFKVLDY